MTATKGFTFGRRFLDIVYDLFDAVTRGSVTYRQVSVWADGLTPMTDSLCDGVSYVADTVKAARVYYERVWSRGIVDLAAYGIIADGQEHGPALQAVLDYFAPVPTEFRLPAGNILVGSGHNFYAHTVRGKGVRRTILKVGGQVGPTSYKGMTLSDLTVSSRGLDQSIGLLPAGQYPGTNTYKGQTRYFDKGFDGDGESVQPEVQATYVVPDFFVRDAALPTGTYPNASYPAGSYWESTTNPANTKRYAVQTSRAYSTNPYDHNEGYGLGIFSTCDVRRVQVSGFALGVNVYGDVNVKDPVNAPQGYIADRCYFENVSVSGCTFGWLFTGGDANQSAVINCEARNVEGWGFMDNSLLCNHFFAPHVIDAGLGSYYVPQSSGYATFTGWYAEQGNFTTGLNRPSRIHGNTTINGGIPGSGVLLFDNAGFTNGSTYQKLIANYLTVNRQLNFSDGGLALYVSQLGSYLNGGNGTGNLLGFFKKGGSVLRGSVPRSRTQAAVAVGNLYQSGILVGAVYDIDALTSEFSTDDYNYQGHMFAPGDVLRNQRYTGTAPRYWVCTQGGTRASYAEGLTATGLGNFASYQLSGPSSVLAAGDYVSIGGTFMQILSMSSPTLFKTDVEVTGSNLTIAYPAPRFAAKERGTGTTAQRPANLRPDDAGWDYWSTDEKRVYTWTGSAWA